MRKQSLWIMGSISAVLVLSFNNCSKGFQSSDVLSEVSETVDSAMGMSRALSQAGFESSSSYSGSGSNQAAVDAANAAYPYKIYIAKSLIGPWVENGPICRGETTYFRTVGFSVQKKIKGCMSLSSKSDCLDLSKHREFTSNEKVNGDIVTVLTASDTSALPLARFTFFMSELVDDRTVTLRTVGTAEAQNCAGGSGSIGGGSSNGSSGSSSASAGKCSWTALTVGNPRKDPAMICDLANVFKQAVDGNGITQSCQCEGVKQPDPVYVKGYMRPAVWGSRRITFSELAVSSSRAANAVNSECIVGSQYDGFTTCSPVSGAPNNFDCQSWTQTCSETPN